MKRKLISLAALSLMLLLCAQLAVPVYAEGMAPVAENLEVSTYRGVSVNGRLSAYDPDGDLVGFEISTDPVKGALELNNDGSFKYTPGEGKKGKDYFGYRAIDSMGNRSQEATVIIKIQKQKTSVSYSDMEDSAGEYYAVALSESGIYTGEKVCGKYCFSPGEEVSRGEFISMCMMAAKEPVFGSVLTTGYGDDESIPAWMKPYAATAAMCGIDSGVVLGEERVFSPDSPISKREAALILNRALGLNDVSYIELDSAVEQETAQACANLSASGIIREGTLIQERLTRLDAAELLIKALELVESR